MDSKNSTSLKVVFGGAAIATKASSPLAKFETPKEINPILATILNRGYDTIDTSRMYGDSEELLGSVAAGATFTIDTKVMSWEPGSHAKDTILKEIDASLDALKIKQINVEYLHIPDRATPFEEPCEAMNIALQAGKIREWGLSNYTADEVENICQICESNGWTKPTVYQGQYNPICRSGEETLFPVLRRHGLRFYAFSPAAGGFFVGSHKAPAPGGRFDTSHHVGKRYAGMYESPSLIDAGDKALQVVAKHGIDGHAAALRWTVHHSVLKPEFGDAVIIGVSSMKQLDQASEAIDAGPLPDEVAEALNQVYEESGEDKVLYHL